MARRARPTAFNVSFPEEASNGSSLVSDIGDDRSSVSSLSKRKERNEDLDAVSYLIYKPL